MRDPFCVLGAVAARCLTGDRASRSVLWEADHERAVAEGGGLCGLENMRTLCVLCHAGASKKQAGRRARRTASPEPSAEDEAQVEALKERDRWYRDGDDDFEGSDAKKAKAAAKQERKSKKASALSRQRLAASDERHARARRTDSMRRPL